MKKLKNKLVVFKETLSDLTEEQMKEAMGGTGLSPCYTNTSPCNTYTDNNTCYSCYQGGYCN